MKKQIIYIGMALTGLTGFASCQTVKPYQKQFLNDDEMELSAKTVELYEINFENYREASSGANGGKTGGGCGCN